MGTLNTNMTFSLKEIITLVVMFAGGISGYVVLTGEVATLKTQVADLQEANKTYASLPADVQKIQIDMEKNAKKTNAIYYGLLAQGIIKPPQ